MVSSSKKLSIKQILFVAGGSIYEEIKMEIHHKVPKFLGGSNEKWNEEVLTTKQHLFRHIQIALELDTSEAWISCIAIISRIEVPKLLKQVINKRYGNSMKGHKRNIGENNPMFGKSGFDSPRHTHIYIAPDGTEYGSSRDAASIYNTTHTTIQNWSKQNKNNWSIK